MKPISLTVQGLRSYRTAQTVDFGGVNLMAIVGDTGAGKSSLLEAITYALYAGSTWSNQPGDLVSDAVRTMRVEFIFAVDGRRWRAVRSMSAGAYPPAVHRLECLDGDERYDGRAESVKAVERILGLDYNGFLRTVILPQGRFAELLTATKGDRDKILKNIFRVDELEATRETARSMVQRLEPRLDALRQQRAMYLPDPAAALAEAEEERAAAERRGEELGEVVAEVGRQRDAVRDAEAEVRRFEQVAAPLEVAAVSAAEVPGRLTVLAERARDLDQAIEATADRIERAEREAGRLAADVAAAAEDGRDATTLTLAGRLLELVPERVQAVHEAALAAESAQHELAEFEREAEELLGEVAAERRLVDAAGERAGALRTAAQAADGALNEATTAVATAVAAVEELDAAQAAVVEATRRSQALATAVTAAVEAAEQADRAASLADEALEQARRRDAAAAAAHDLHPGDPCPVCERTLPADFAPPEAAALARAQKEAERNRRTAKEAHRVVARAETDRDRGDDEVATAEQRRAQALTRLDSGLARTARSLAPVPAADDHTTDDHTTDAHTTHGLTGEDLVDPEGLLAPLRERRSRAADALRQAEGAERQAEQRLAGLLARGERVTGELERRSRRADQEAKRAGKAREVLERDLAALDARWRPASLDDGEVAQRRQAVERLLDQLDQLARARKAADREVDEARRARDDARRLRGDSVDRPARRATQAVADLAATARSVAVHLGAEPPPPAPADDQEDLVETAAWAADVLQAAASLTAVARGRGEAAAARAQRAGRRTARALAQVGVDDAEGLQRAHAGALAAVQVATARAQEAGRQVPVVADLERRTTEAERFLTTLQLVKDKLADGAFVGALISRRQQALLGVATTILGDITAKRFGFSSDFQVVDRLSGRPRSPRTLSGGESFLASLALALAMVELASRAGGRLDALFLDEGFGALDASSLDAAVDALEQRAHGGRLVAVISHVRAVAERIPNVLTVRADTAAGTTLRWLTTDEHAAELEGDAADTMAGLLS